jgi:Flp pilus assembly protein TadG
MTRVAFARRVSGLWGRLLGHRRGNVAVVAALTAIPLTMALGMCVDYALAGYKQDQINGIADAATLAGVTPQMMSTASAAQSQQVAQNMFLSQLSSVPNINIAGSKITVTATDTPNGATITRSLTLRYTVASTSVFGPLIGMTNMQISGQSAAVSATAPNINFWMLLDDSPSMAIAATTADIATLVAATPKQGGCAFACHEINPTADNLGNPGGPTQDNYALARSLGVTLRIDLVNNALQQLLATASTTQSTFHTTYDFAIYTMDYNLTAVGNGSQANAYAKPTPISQIVNPTIAALEVYNQSCITQTNCNNDTDSYLDATTAQLGAYIYANDPPGNGTNNPGDHPQAVLFIVSDGVTDYVSGGSRLMSPISRNIDSCTAIKNEGIRIAFLYTTYYPLPTNSFYNSNIAPFQPSVATYAQNCASPGLYFQVSTDGDITGAMTTLFQRAVATARLTS